jgi:hypothetical protein
MQMSVITQHSQDTNMVMTLPQRHTRHISSLSFPVCPPYHSSTNTIITTNTTALLPSTYIPNERQTCFQMHKGIQHPIYKQQATPTPGIQGHGYPLPYP